MRTLRRAGESERSLREASVSEKSERGREEQRFGQGQFQQERLDRDMSAERSLSGRTWREVILTQRRAMRV